MGRLLLCTDLDGTLLPNGRAHESRRARDYFARLVARENVTLVFVTGRDRTLVESAVGEFDLPAPDYVVGDVGTTIYRVAGDDWRAWSRWLDHIAADWRGRSGTELAALIPDLAGLTLQEPRKQGDCKVSFYVDLDADRSEIDDAIASALARENLAANRIWSVDESARVGLLDIVPARASKLHALDFLHDSLGFEYGDTLFAGDSGNDLHVLVSAIPSVLVANAAPEVARQAMDEAARAGTSDRLYLARGGFLGMNGNYAAGILEGVAHFHPDMLHDLAAEYD